MFLAGFGVTLAPACLVRVIPSTLQRNFIRFRMVSEILSISTAQLQAMRMAGSHSCNNLPHVHSCMCGVLILRYCQAPRFTLSRIPQQLALATLSQSSLQGRDWPGFFWLIWEQPYRLALVKQLGIHCLAYITSLLADDLQRIHLSAVTFWSSKGGKTKWTALKYTKNCQRWNYWWGKGKDGRRKMFSYKCVSSKTAAHVLNFVHLLLSTLRISTSR